MKIGLIFFGITLGFSSPAFAAGGVPVMIDFYKIATNILGIDKMWIPTVGALLVLCLLTVMGLFFRSSLAADGQSVEPNGKFSLRFVLEGILGFVLSLAKDNCGDQYRKYFAFLAALFLFILVSNLTGLIPGFPPPTLSILYFAWNFYGSELYHFSRSALVFWFTGGGCSKFRFYSFKRNLYFDGYFARSLIC
jgi:hypothetical protein